MKDLKLWGIFISLIIVVQALGFFRIFRHCLVFIPRRHIKSGSLPYAGFLFSPTPAVPH